MNFLPLLLSYSNGTVIPLKEWWFDDYSLVFHILLFVMVIRI